MGRDLTFINVNGVKSSFLQKLRRHRWKTTKGPGLLSWIWKSGNNPWLIKGVIDTRLT
jgi:hypothetical protein